MYIFQFDDFEGKIKNRTLKRKIFHSFQYLFPFFPPYIRNIRGGEMIFRENIYTRLFRAHLLFPRLMVAFTVSIFSLYSIKQKQKSLRIS